MNDTQGLLPVPIMKLILPPNGTHRDGASRFYVFGRAHWINALHAWEGFVRHIGTKVIDLDS